jgi:transcriptional regulator with XRE-family HTH domain
MQPQKLKILLFIQKCYRALYRTINSRVKIKTPENLKVKAPPSHSLDQRERLNKLMGLIAKNGITHKQLAKELGCTPVYLSMLLNGTRKPKQLKEIEFKIKFILSNRLDHPHTEINIPYPFKRSKFTIENVKEIRESKLSCKILAERYDVLYRHIWDIKNFRTYKNIN